MKYLVIILFAFVFGFVAGLLFPSKHRKKYGGLRKKGKSKTTYPGYTSYIYH